MLFMGIDVGSSGVKVSLVDHTGEVRAFAQRGYSFECKDGKSELDPDMVFCKVEEAIKAITSKCDVSQLATIGTTSFGEMFVLLDNDRKVLCHSISYNDSRGEEEARKLEAEPGNDRIYEITGATINGMYSLPKLLWIKKNCPKIYEKAKTMCLFADFVLMRLGAETHMDYSLASRTLMFDVRNRCWSKEILEYTGIRSDILPKPVASGTIVGRINSRIAKKLGLPDKVLLLAGGHDQSCAALGAGITKAGKALDGMGSNECIVPVFEQVMIGEKMKQANLVCVPYILPEMYATYAFNRSAGTVLDWYARLLGDVSYETLFDEMSKKPSEMLFLPHFSGAATPYMDDHAQGAIVGLHLGRTRGEVTRSIVEGLQFEMRINLECLKAAGFVVQELFASGGMAGNDQILQIKADILNIPVHRLENSQTGTMAMVILGSVAKGVFPDISTAAEALVKNSKTFYPNEGLGEKYSEMFEQYRRMYDMVRTLQGR